MDKIKSFTLILICSLSGFLFSFFIFNSNTVLRLIDGSYSQLKLKFSKSNSPAQEKKNPSELFKKNSSLKKEYQNQKNIEQTIDYECRSMIRKEITYIDNFQSEGLSVRKNNFTVYKLAFDYENQKFLFCKNVGTFEFNKVYTKGEWQFEFDKLLKQCDTYSYCNPIKIFAYAKNNKYSNVKKISVFKTVGNVNGKIGALEYYGEYDKGNDIFDLNIDYTSLIKYYL